MNLVIVTKDEIDSGKVVLRDRRFQHIKTILKSTKGEKIRVGQLDGLMGEGLLIAIDEHMAEIELNLFIDPPAPLNLHLILAMPRPKAFKRIIESVTALGIKKITLINSWRVDKSYWDSPVLSSENLHGTMVRGLEQARDTVLPEVKIEKLFKPFVEDRLPELLQGKTALLAHPGHGKLSTIFPEKECVFAIGPDGGFIDYEVQKLKEAGFHPFSCGERILRVETAVSYIAGMVNSTLV